MKITITAEYEHKKTLSLKHVTFAIAVKWILTASSDFFFKKNMALSTAHLFPKEEYTYA